MKKLTKLLLLSFFFFSCKKEMNNNVQNTAVGMLAMNKTQYPGVTGIKINKVWLENDTVYVNRIWNGHEICWRCTGTYEVEDTLIYANTYDGLILIETKD